MKHIAASLLLLCLFALLQRGIAENPRPTGLYYRILDSYLSGHLNLIEEQLQARGYERNDFEEDWSLSWVHSYGNIKWANQTEPWQRVNLIPGRPATLKHNLAKIFPQQEQRFPGMFPFWPSSLNLDNPKQYKQLLDIYENHAKKPDADPLIYIIKHPNRGRGQGIHLIGSAQDLEALNKPGSKYYPFSKSKPIAQKYVSNPLTLEGHKCILRVWVAVTSVNPLRTYVYSKVLIRIASKKFTLDLNNLNDLQVHVESRDVNLPNSNNFEESMKNTGLEHDGMLADFDYLKRKLKEQGVDVNKLWDNIRYAATMGFVAAEVSMAPQGEKHTVQNRTRRLNHFDLLGLDILVDTDYNTYLLEINDRPSMVTVSDGMGKNMKRRMLGDLFDLIDITNNDYDRVPALVDEHWPLIQEFPPDYFIEGSSNRFLPSWIKTRNDMWAIVETELENERREKTLFEQGFPSPQFRKALQIVTHNSSKPVFEWVDSGMKLSLLKQHAEDIKKKKDRVKKAEL